MDITEIYEKERLKAEEEARKKAEIDWGDYNNFKDFLNDCNDYCDYKGLLLSSQQCEEKYNYDFGDIERLTKNTNHILNVYDVKNTEELIKLTTENYKDIEQFYKEEYEDEGIDIEDEMHDLLNEYIYIMDKLHCLKKREKLNKMKNMEETIK